MTNSIMALMDSIVFSFGTNKYLTLQVAWLDANNNIVYHMSLGLTI